MTDAPAPDAIRTIWLYAGLADEIAEDGAHLTVDAPGLSLTVQNFRGKLRGFWNVCSHRSVTMRPAGCGFGALRCPYHGWTYNAEGVPIGIPENELFFGLDADAKRSLALRPAAVATVGPFVFLNGAADAEPLRAGSEVAALRLSRETRVAAEADWSGVEESWRLGSLVIERRGGSVRLGDWVQERAAEWHAVS